MKSYDIGVAGEERVANDYLSKGYSVLARNFVYQKGNLGRIGEIDIIVTKDNIVCLVEVKSRSTNTAINPIYTMNQKKLTALYKAYQFFLLKNPEYKKYSCRVDYAEVVENKVKILPNCWSFE